MKLPLLRGPLWDYKGNMSEASNPVERKKRGRPRGSAYADPIPMRFKKELLERVDAWRAEQPDTPPRSVAIRRLVEAALERGAEHSGTFV